MVVEPNENNDNPFKQHSKTQYQHTHMLWDGDRPIQEVSDTHVYTTVYDQSSFVPIARAVWLKEGLTLAANDDDDDSYVDDNDPYAKPKSSQSNIQVFYYHNDQLGTPNELTNDEGEVVWLADYEAWGNVNKEIWREETLKPLQIENEYLQPIRFQGQYFDEETGLHYNRFRYYDPDMGMFILRDPIGLLGGENVFQYAPNPTGFIDPLGLHEETVDTRGIEEALSTPIFIHQIRIAAKLSQAISGSKTDENLCTSSDCPEKCLPATVANIRTVLAPTKELTVQKSVSSPVIQAYVNMIEMGQTNMPPIKMSSNIVVDGNHRFIAAKLCGMNAPIVPWSISPGGASTAYPIKNIKIDLTDWGNR